MVVDFEEMNRIVRLFAQDVKQVMSIDKAI